MKTPVAFACLMTHNHQNDRIDDRINDDKIEQIVLPSRPAAATGPRSHGVCGTGPDRRRRDGTHPAARPRPGRRPSATAPSTSPSSARWRPTPLAPFQTEHLTGALAEALGVEYQDRARGNLQPAPGREVGESLVDRLARRADQLS